MMTNASLLKRTRCKRSQLPNVKTSLKYVWEEFTETFDISSSSYLGTAGTRIYKKKASINFTLNTDATKT